MGEEGDRGESSRKPIEVKVFGRTDVGLVREHNEDNFLVADLETGNRSLLPEVRDHEVGERGTLLAVCDGMGGAAAGEVASQIAVDTVYDLMLSDAPPESVESLAKRLEAAVLDAGKRIFDSARADRSRRGMGTTITAATLISDRIIFAQVGDSRAYLIRNKKMVQVTRDQSLVNQLIEAGQLKPEEAELFEHSNIILQALGTAEDVTVDLTFADLKKGDIVVMCSDGLSGLVSDDRIRDIVLEGPEPIDACKTLTEAARDAGGHDNITVIVARFDGEGLEAPSEDEVAEFQRLDIPGRAGFHPRQPQKMRPPSSYATDDEDDDTIADASLADEMKTVRDRPADRRGRQGLFGANPLFMGVAVIVVLAVGVGLGYLIVSGTVGETEDAAPPPPAETGPEEIEQAVACHFTADAPGTRLVIDGQDYGELPADGRWISLDVGLHSVEGRHGADVVVQQRLPLRAGQETVEVPLLIAAALALNAPDDGGALSVSADAGIDFDGGPSTAEAGPDQAGANASPAIPRDVAPGQLLQGPRPIPSETPLTKLPPAQRNPPRRPPNPPNDVSSPNPY